MSTLKVKNLNLTKCPVSSTHYSEHGTAPGVVELMLSSSENSTRSSITSGFPRIMMSSVRGVGASRRGSSRAAAARRGVLLGGGVLLG